MDDVLIQRGNRSLLDRHTDTPTLGIQVETCQQGCVQHCAWSRHFRTGLRNTKDLLRLRGKPLSLLAWSTLH